MDQVEHKEVIARLIVEAPEIAPSIRNFAELHNYGNVTDESLDTQRFLRWEVEARALFQELAGTNVQVFKELYVEYTKIKGESSKYHSRSILAHQVLELLQSAQQLIGASSVIKHPRDRAVPDRRALILTALGLETTAVLSHLDAVKEADPVKGTVFYEGRFQGVAGEWLIKVAEVGAANAPSAVTAERAITDFNPAVAIFIGIAGGVKDVELGDVVAATEVYGYERGKAETESFRPRPSVARSAYALEQRARVVLQAAKWPNRIKSTGNKVPRGFVGPIAAGEKVIASDRAAVARFINEYYSGVLAVEMEGRGFLETIHMNPDVAGLVVRGISDRLTGKGEADAVGWQPIAARNAAALAFEILATYVWPENKRSPQADKSSTEPSTRNDVSFESNPTLDGLIGKVVPGDHNTSDAAAVEFLTTAGPDGGGALFQSLLDYQHCQDEDLVWKALPLIGSLVRLAPWLIDQQELRRMGSHPNLAVRSAAASICWDLAEYAPDRVPIDLAIKLSVYDEDWYVQAPANVALKTMAGSMPGVLRIFFMRLHSGSPGERENAASMLVDVAEQEPELLDIEELRGEFLRLQRAGDEAACAYLAKALVKVEGAPLRQRYKYAM